MAQPNPARARPARALRRIAPAVMALCSVVPVLGAAAPDEAPTPQPLSNSPLDIGPAAPAEPLAERPEPLAAPTGPLAAPEIPPVIAEVPAAAATPISPRELQPLGPGADRTKTTERALRPRNPGGAPIGSDNSSGAADGAVGQNKAAGAGWVTRTGVALGLVLALILSIKWATQRLARRAGGLAWQLGPAGRAPSGVLEVLGRFPVSRGHSLILLKMDRRVLLLGQSSAGFTTLSQVIDPEEVASLIIKTRDEEGASLAARFNEILHGMERDPALVGDDAPEISPGAPATGPRLPRIGLSTVNA